MKFHYFKLFLALFFSSFLLLGCGGKTEEDVAKSYFTAIADGKIDNAIALIDLSDIKANELGLMKEKIKAMLLEEKDNIAGRGGIKSIEATEKTVSEDGNRAALKILLTWGNGSTEEERVNLVKVNGEWKISL